MPWEKQVLIFYLADFTFCIIGMDLEKGTIMKAIKKAYNGLIKTTAIAIAAPGYAFTKTAKAITYGVTENETARWLVDLYEAGGELLMVGALSIGKEV